jgi:DNA-binding MarR family transcriptional regulator
MDKKDDRLIYLLFTAQQKLRTYLKNTMVSEGIKVTVAQAGILFLLKQKNDRTMTELSRLLSIDNSTITGLVDRLEKTGLVRRSQNPDDRRASRVYITSEGIEEINRAKIVILKVNDEIKNSHTDVELDHFKKVLRGVVERFNA